MKRSPFVIALVLAAACAGSPPAVAPAPIAKPVVAPPPAAPAATTSAAAATTQGAPSAPTSVFVPRASVGPLVLLFPEEIEAIRARIEARLGTLAGRPLACLPDDRLQQLEQVHASGRLREGGPVCARPPTMDRVLEVGAPRVPSLHIQLDCFDACSLEADLADAGGEDLGRWTAAPAADDPTAWLQAADALAPSDTGSGGGMGMGRGGPPPQVRATIMSTVGDFGPRSAQDAWQGPTRELSACHDASAAHVADVDVWRLLAVDDAGHPTRCAARHDADGGQSGAGDCICTALAHASFPAGHGPRRALVLTTDYGPPAGDVLRTPEGQFAVQVIARGLDDPGDQGLQQALGGPEVARCMVARGKTAPASVQVSLDADAAGRVTRATAQSDEPALATCVEKALPHVALDCSTDGAPHSASATLMLTTFGPLGPARTH